MIPHVLIVDDEEDVLDALVPGFLRELSQRLARDDGFRAATSARGIDLPRTPLNLSVSAHGYQSQKVPRLVAHSPVHLRLHLCCEKGGSFTHSLRLLKEQFVAVVVSDLRFADDGLGARAGRLFVDDVERRNPETFAVLYSAYQRPDGFPPERFVRKGAANNLGGEELLEKIVQGLTQFFQSPRVGRLAAELARRGLAYESDAFGTVLRRLTEYARLYFDVEEPDARGRRRPRPMLLLDGETGTGKTELAHLLHQVSGRAAFPFVAATCNQLTDETFLRSTLFGHVKGSFSGATTDRPGLVQSAGKGILLLDDLHKLTDGASMILHSFLDDGEYSHLGQDETRRSALAAIVATVETPRWEEIKRTGALSESFIHRVEQLIVRIPPLRERPEDIALQTKMYVREFAKAAGVEIEITEGAIAWLKEDGFAGGNSRRLRDFLKGVVSTNARVLDQIDVGELREHAREIGSIPKRPAAGPTAVARPPAADSAESSAWSERITRLAARALAEELSLPEADAFAKIEQLFADEFGRVWESLRAVANRLEQKQVDIKLTDELLRYFLVRQTGSPAKAAKELGMKDNALREFIYSREDKRRSSADGNP